VPREGAAKKTKDKCCAAGCKAKLTLSNTQQCTKCLQKTCLTHRFEELHQCPAVRQMSNGITPAALAAERRAHQQQQVPSKAAPKTKTSTMKKRGNNLRDDPSNSVKGTADRRRQGGAKAESTEICAECGAHFSNLADLIAHSDSFHSSATPLQAQAVASSLERCQQCGADFNSVVELIAHAETFHSSSSAGNAAQSNTVSQSLQPCPFCGQTFGSEQMLISHVESHQNASAQGLSSSRQTVVSNQCVCF